PLSASPPRTSTICSTPCSPPLPAESPRRAKDSAPGERRYGRPCHVQPLSWCVRELVATGWTQAAGARAADGREVDPWTDDAVAWSLLGAIVAALEEQARQAGGELQLGAQLTDDGVAAAWSRPRDEVRSPGASRLARVARRWIAALAGTFVRGRYRQRTPLRPTRAGTGRRWDRCAVRVSHSAARSGRAGRRGVRGGRGRRACRARAFA